MDTPAEVRTGLRPGRPARVLLLAVFVALGACDDDAAHVVVDAGPDAAADSGAPDTAEAGGPDIDRRRRPRHDARHQQRSPPPTPARATRRSPRPACTLTSRTAWSPSDVRSFQPAHQLWSDAAEKQRWIRLPPGHPDRHRRDGPLAVPRRHQAVEAVRARRQGAGDPPGRTLRTRPRGLLDGQLRLERRRHHRQLRRRRPDQHQRHPARRPRRQDLRVLPPRRQGPGAGRCPPCSCPTTARA